MDINELISTLLGISLSGLITTVIVFVVGLFAVKYLTRLVSNLLARGGRLDASLCRFITKAINAIFFFILVIICAGQLGLPITSLVTILGAFGFAISLALQDSLKNLASGLFILGAKPFATGDFIETGSISGTVEVIGIIHTQLLTPDNRRIYVPNGTVSGSTIVNYSAKGERRLELIIPIPYAADIETAKELIAAIVKADKRILQQPAPFIRLWGLSATAADIIVQAWCNIDDSCELRCFLLESIKKALDAAEMALPAGGSVTIRGNEGK